MPPLPRLQHHMQAAILHGRDRAMTALVRADGIAPERRIGIHRNHFALSLGDALSATFPTVRALVGEDFFAQAARAFVRAHPPAGPCLFEYGGDFPAFLRCLREAAALPYLPDIARFDWAVNEAAHAPDAPALVAQALAGLSPDDLGRCRLEAHPSLRRLRSVFPLPSIRAVAQPGAPETARVDLGAGAAHLAVWRNRDDDVVWLDLDPSAWVALDRLAAGEPLQVAATACAAADLTALLATVVLEGAFTSLGRTPA